MWLIIKNTVNVSGKLFYEGVSWENWKTIGISTNENVLWKEFNQNPNDYIGIVWDDFKVNYRLRYVLEVDGIEYKIDGDNVILSNRKTYTENISQSDYKAKKNMDKTTDYYKTVKEVLGIDMKENHVPQFRDGVNPAKDHGEIQT